MTLVLAVLSTGLLGILTGAQLRRVSIEEGWLRELSQIRGLVEGWDPSNHEPLIERLNLLESDVERLPRTWDQIKREAASAETRARYHARRALDELEERGLTSPGLEGVASELFADNGEAGRAEGLQPVPETLEGPPVEPDYLTLANRRKYGA